MVQSEADYFNSKMVRLEAPNNLSETGFFFNFNSKMVRLEAGTIIRVDASNYISIPKWYD